MNGLVPGTLIAQRYRLSAPLGAGMQGSVWEAVDTRRGGALCAIKFAGTARTQRIEAEVLLAVEHPSLPKATDYGVHENGTFLVLERVLGTPLESGMDTRTVLRALADVASALAALHDAGLVHGDVKPSNILVGPERAWLADLGLSSAAGTSAPAGTLAFMAPETLAGERGAAGDLYALGVTATIVLTKQHPLVTDPSDRSALLTAIALGSHPREEAIAAIPSAAREAIATLLSPDPERRGASARAWLARLARDVSAELTASQRSQALAPRRDRPTRLPLLGRGFERESAQSAMTLALAGKALGVVFVGPPGAGRKRLADDVIRTIQIAGAASAQLPEVVDEIPIEPTRATLVRRIDASRDDLRASAQVIERLARFTDLPKPVVLVATCTESVGITGLREISVGSLDSATLGSLLETVAGRAIATSSLDAWMDASDGLPGRAIALADQLDVESIAGATREDLARTTAPDAGAFVLRSDLSPETRRGLILLAAAGEPVTLDELAAMLGGTSSLGIVHDLIRRGFAVERDGLARLSMPIALDKFSPRDRIELGTFLDENGPDRNSVRARAAILRGDHAAVVQHALAAANETFVGPAARIHWLESALQFATERKEIALRLAAELLIIGEPARAIEVLAPLGNQPDVMAARADAYRRAGKPDQARALALELEARNEPESQAVARIVLARDALDRSDLASAEERIKGLADLNAASSPMAARALEVGALIALARGNESDARAQISRVESIVAESGDRVQAARIRSIHGMLLQQQGTYAGALEAYRDAWALASAAGDMHGAATYAVNLGAAELECGALGEAAHWITRGVRTLAKLGRMTDLARSLANLASLHAFIGDRPSALDDASRAEEAAASSGDLSTEALARMIAAEVSLDGLSAGEALVGAAHAAARGGNESLAGDSLARAAIAFSRAGEIAKATDALAKATDAPTPILAIAALDLALSKRESTDEISHKHSAMRDAVVRELTLEHELHALELSVRVAEYRMDGDETRRARAVHFARVEALAATLPDALAALFRDHHTLTDTPISYPASQSTARGSNDPRWRQLAEITREINTETRLRPLLERVMDAIVSLTGAARGFLLLKGPDGSLRIRTARNIGRRDLAGEEMALSRSVAERVARTGEALVTVDATTDRRFDTYESVHAMRLRSILAVPLVVHGEIVGTVYVDDRFRAQAFGDDALEIAREFAEAAAVAIQNTRTKALLRRALFKAERLSRELKKRVDAQSVELEATRRALSVGIEPRGRYDEIIGRGPAMRRTLQLVDKVAPTAMPVLLLGESGTGKELVARAIHANSPRTSRPFVAENCGAIPETLLESVLFGHVKGAFTGADRNRAGLFEVADNGTLFLDEIGEMPPSMQAKLLRVLQDGELRPLGGDRARKVDVRVIAATHRDLSEMVRLGKFREDLFYRLAVMVIPVPALRQRREDLPELINHFINKHAKRPVGVDRRAMNRLVGHTWPGNVRQLENELMRASVMAEGTIHEEDLSPALLAQAAPTNSSRDPLDLKSAVEELERQLIDQALKQHNGNQSRAAKTLGLSRFGLQKKLKRLMNPNTSTDDDDDVAEPPGLLRVAK